jgi:hypothetical protein
MRSNKVYVQKRGNVYCVPMDIATGRAIPVSSYDEEVAGFPFTCTSETELKMQFPNSEFVFLTEPEQKPNVIVPTEAVRQQANVLLKSLGLETPPTPVKVVQVPIAAESQRILEQVALGPKGKAEEFLKRLQTALQYASKKHEKKLKDQVEIIEELIREVF